MSRKYRFVGAALVTLAVLITSAVYLSKINIPVLDAQGPIGRQERNLIILAVGLSAIVVIPVYFMLIFFAWRYREGNKKAKYQPNFDHNRAIETIWWGVPLIIITILAVVTWKSSYNLDPFRSISSTQRPMTIQVVALQWNWLFIYPQQHIATVNYVQFPQKTPVDFEITADAPMNSLWIPQLGGQIYAMSGMATHLHLLADRVGNYYGSSANISGRGFAKMNFVASSLTSADFAKWVRLTQQTPNKLDLDSYNQLAKPGTNPQVTFYASVQDGLFSQIVNKFIEPPQFSGGGV